MAMSRIVIVKCDLCREEFDEGCRGMAIRRMSWENTRLDWRKIEGDFCCVECAISFLEEHKHGQ
jgi:hypothetical protein